MWTSTQNHPQGAGILSARLLVFSSCFAQWFLAGGFCSLCHSLGMDLPGTAISLSRGMFLPRLGIHFGPFCVISRCLDWCLLGKWIRRSRGSERGLCCRSFDCKFFCVVPNIDWHLKWISSVLNNSCQWYYFHSLLCSHVFNCLFKFMLDW